MPLPDAPAGFIYLSAAGAALIRATLTPRPETSARSLLSEARSDLFGPELRHPDVGVEVEAGRPSGAVRVSVRISVLAEGEVEEVLRSLAAFSAARETVMEVAVKREDSASESDAALAERVGRLLAGGGHATREVVLGGENPQGFLSGEDRTGLRVGTGGDRDVMRLLVEAGLCEGK
ncbi:hypothetical protein [Rubrobacter indicoceani]|uniref:hypothetical protein n=1 Tax=Rubrobacter indicoceani TaxID=2051957 RepID=UPI000E5B9EE9|nr:hypothetical protein [Rubrobacter indicoceani]